MKKRNYGKIIKNTRINDTNIYHMEIKPEYEAPFAKPGQFVNIRCSNGTSPLLRRPISVLRNNKETKTYEICYEVKGEGTRYLANLDTGERIDYLGPLGNEFKIKDDYEKIAVIGGGIGIFPLIHTLDALPDGVIGHAYFGFKNKSKVVLENDINTLKEDIYIATDDGSYGYQGYITDIFKKKVRDVKYDAVFTCGPVVMMRKCASICKDVNIPCYVSMEERMGCGIGACLVCACKVKRKDGSSTYAHVCKDGPVFSSEEIIF